MIAWRSFAGQLVHTQMMAELRRQHRIRARLTGPLPPVPDDVNGELSVYHTEGDQLTIEAPGELSSILGWLSSLPLDEVTIEPFGLRAVYDRYHVNEGTTVATYMQRHRETMAAGDA